MRRINISNLKLLFLILSQWVRASFQVTIRPPESYLRMVLNMQQEAHDLTDKDRITIRKVVKVTMKISLLFQKKRRCLIQSLIVYYVLKKREINSYFQLGVKKENERISTHAWIEIDRKIIIGGAVEGYQKFLRTH